MERQLSASIRLLFFLLDPIADADLRFKVLRSSRVRLELSANIRHVDPQYLLVKRRRRAPNTFNYIVLGEYASGVARQQL